jgi:hypothetical protein
MLVLHDMCVVTDNMCFRLIDRIVKRSSVTFAQR